MSAPDYATAAPIDDLRIAETQTLASPAEIVARLPAEAVARQVSGARAAVDRILSGADQRRLLVVVGPCSIHHKEAALEYGARLKKIAAELAEDLQIVMRVYFEKPRTTVGWKGLINDPKLDGSHDINRGLFLARDILLELNRLGVPCGTEFLDVISPQFYADLITWGAIGARTTESQTHRELASGLSCAVGFKNGTDGNVKVAADAVLAARQPHRFLSVDKKGRATISVTTGNDRCHIILRGGGGEPNYDAKSVAAAEDQLAAAGMAPRLMIDFSHANSGKDHRRQPAVCDDVARQMTGGDVRIVGVMIESHLVEGRQDVTPGEELVFGQSITDACAGWEDTEKMLQTLAAAARARHHAISESE